jgi:ubiquinone/menaquinone biosynthesis C-methylase UbiE
MKQGRGFDQLAWVYRALEYLAFGRDLERARFAHLARLRACRTILVLGEGDGRCLAQLVVTAPGAMVDCLDLSPRMLQRAAARLDGRAEAARVNFRQADLLEANLPAAHYDAVVTCFFLDCFTAEQAAAIMARIDAAAKPGALWLWADFARPERGWRRWRARVWLAVLYAFFRWQTGLSARKLPPVEQWLADWHWQPVVRDAWQHGLIASAVFRRGAEPGFRLVTDESRRA